MKKTLPASLFLSALTAVGTAQTEHPNVLLILVDDLGYSDIEPFGQEKIQTPNLVKMAENGLSFTQFYAGSTVSAPSRASLMTGLHTGHTYIRGNRERKTEGQEPVGSDKTLGEFFKQAGYATGAFGKWGLGYPGSGAEPTDRGFDRFYGYNCQREAHTYYPGHLWDNKKIVQLNKQSYSQDLIHEQILAFIRENKNRPFFGYLAYTLPHAGLEQPNDSILKMYSGKFPEKPFRGAGSYAAAAEPRAQFAAMVTRMDAYVGQIRQELEQLGIAENTLLIFTSDNGPHREGGADPDFFKNEQTLRGLKRSLYEGGIRVPTIMEWRGTIKPGQTSDLQAAFWDFMPTFVQLTGQKNTWKQPTDGISIVPTLTSKGHQKKHKFLYWEFHEQGGRQAILSGNWKLIKQNINSGQPTFELYNIKTDPFEKDDLAARYPTKVKKLSKKMEQARTHSDLFNFGM